MPVVIVDKLAGGHAGLSRQFTSAFERMEGMRHEFNEARAVFIKPNLTYPEFKAGVTTRVEFVAALVGALRGINESTKIYIGEGEGGYNSFSMSEAMSSMGFYEIEQSYPNVEVINLSKLPRQTFELNVKGKGHPIDLPRIFFDEIDFSITCPLPKVHGMTRITLAFKNQWGCLPDVMRLKNHYVFDEIIGRVCNVLKFRYAFLDGKYGLDDNGPMNGVPIEVNWFAASNSLGAFDMVVSGMMGVDWRTVGHLRRANAQGFLPDRKDMEVIGDPESLKRKFRLRRGFWNYPALAAFQSKSLTHLFYFSRWAKLLHDVMYTFRERPIA